jgi:2-C-methyl-D-erythritol 4-phosphate cytidylyltransferase
VVERTLDRSSLWAAQTPQVFRVQALRAALEIDAETRDAATDEAMLVEAAGGTVLIHPTSEANPKITTPLDLELAELLLTERIRGNPP